MTVPPADPWLVAIHTGDGAAPAGAGVVIEADLILTAAHVIRDGDHWRDEIWVTFPKAGVGPDRRRRVRRCQPEHPDDSLDVALLRLDGPVPAQVSPARIRCPSGPDLAGRRWWSFGFPDFAGVGNDAGGTVGAALAYGHVRLDTTSKWGVEQGFSGGPVWCPEYRAVVGVVVSAGGGRGAGDGHALTLHHISAMMPQWQLEAVADWRARDAGDTALADWGWRLAADPEHRRHWSPRARGVTGPDDPGYRFQGRRAALTEVIDWLRRPEPDHRVLVVTGSPGAGKSAVLGRVVTTADPELVRHLPRDDDAVRAPSGAVACAVHAKGKSADEIATEIARGAGLPLPATAEEVAPALRDRLTARPGRFNLIVDAVDEASRPEEARRLIHAVLLPLIRLAGVGVQVVVGTRRSDRAGDLLREFAGQATVVDLDDPRYFAEADLVAYARATLRLTGADRPDNPYLAEEVAGPVAERIAGLADGNFLIAGLVAHTHGRTDTAPATPEQIGFPATVDDALDAQLARLPPVGACPARLLLTVLAYAEAPGLPVSLWLAGVAALGGTATEPALRDFARASAAAFLLETGGAAPEPRYRLFHQALNEALLRHRRDEPVRAEEEARLVTAWLDHGQAGGWASAPRYLLRSLPRHAHRSGQVDRLLADDEYLRYADLRQLLPVVEDAGSEVGRARAWLLRRTPTAVDADPLERAAMLTVSQCLDNLDSRFHPPGGVPYRGRWARTPARTERAVLEGHGDAVWDVCWWAMAGRSLLASAGGDGTVRIWDAATGQTEHVLTGHTDRVHAVTPVPAAGRTLLASASADGTVRLWEPETGAASHVLVGHTDWVRGLAVIRAGRRVMLASVGDDGTVIRWDPATGRRLSAADHHHGWLTAACPVPTGRSDLLATAGFDGVIRLWPAEPGDCVRELVGHAEWVTSLCTVRSGERHLLASAGYDREIRVWDPETGRLVRTLAGPGRPVTGLAAVPVAGREMLAASSEDGTVRLWDPVTGLVGRVLDGHTDRVRAVCAVPVAGCDLLASAGDDGTVRLWEPRTGTPGRVIDGGRVGPVAALTEVSVTTVAVPVGAVTVPPAPVSLIASAGDDGTVRLWEPRTGAAGRNLVGHTAPVTALCTVPAESGRLLVSASEDTSIRLWRPDTGELVRSLDDHHTAVTAVCAVPVADGHRLASTGRDHSVRLWHPDTGLAERMMDHGDWGTALRAVRAADEWLLVSAGANGTLRAWDPVTGRPRWSVPGHHGRISALCRLPRRDGDDLLVSAGADRAIRCWQAGDGKPVRTMVGHAGPVTDLRLITVDRTPWLISASEDRTVRWWDPVDGSSRRTVPVHHRALACRQVAGVLVLGLDVGLLALSF